MGTGSTAYTIEPNNAAIYPASAATAPSQVILQNGTRPADYQVTFGRPITDPVLLVYSVETTALNFSATRTEGGDPATVNMTMNVAGRWNATTQVFSASRSPNDGWSLEGCSQYQTYPSIDQARPSRRACAVMRFTGTYSAIQFRANVNDGVGFQVGFDDPTLDPIVPVPTLSQTGLVALGLGMLGFAAWRTRRGRA